MKKIKVGIIGAGSLGSLFGRLISLISTENYYIEVTLFGRKEHMDVINHDGLIIQEKQNNLRSYEIKAFYSMEHFIKSGKESSYCFDFLFLTTKAHNIDSAMLEYKMLIDNSKSIVILQNGIGNEQHVKKYCSEKKIIRVLTSHGALLKEPGIVIHTGVGITKIGFPFEKNLEVSEEKLKHLAEIFTLAGIETLITDNIKRECWEKVFVNIGINAIGALTRLRNGEMLKIKEVRNIMDESVKEALEIAEKVGIKLKKKNYIEIMRNVAKNTSDNLNSMLQDILKGKKTEIDYINGKVVEIAREKGINVPVNQMLTNLIKGLEKSTIIK